MANRGRSSGDAMLNAIIAVVIVVVLGLGVWAVVPKISENLKNREAETGAETMTIADVAAAEGITFDEYMEKYGLTGSELTAEDSYQTAFYAMTAENFAKANGTTFEDLVSEYQLPETVTADMVWGDAMLEMPAGVAMGGDDQFEQAKETYGLGDEFTAQSRWGDVQNAIIEKMVSEQAAEAVTDDTATEAVTDDATAEATDDAAAESEE